jgi:hypothetical protein
VRARTPSDLSVRRKRNQSYNPVMDANSFIHKWAAAKGGERASAHEHFIDLCRLVGEQTPTEADPAGDFYAFEKGARTPDGNGFADVWLKNHFAWEYKGKRKDLIAAYKQVSDYREALGNPPLLSRLRLRAIRNPHQLDQHREVDLPLPKCRHRHGRSS